MTNFDQNTFEQARDLVNGKLVEIFFNRQLTYAFLLHYLLRTINSTPIPGTFRILRL